MVDEDPEQGCEASGILLQSTWLGALLANWQTKVSSPIAFEEIMSIQIACPRCTLIVERDSLDSLPTHCPECWTRLTCPLCRLALTRHPEQAQLIHCSRCEITLAPEDTINANQLTASQVVVPPVIPGFEVRQLLGRGGMGLVYRAYKQSLECEVAIKILTPALADDPRWLDLFREEAKIAAGLLSSHILPVHDIIEVRGSPVIVMPLVEGCNLGKVLEDRILVKDGKPPPQAHPWALLDDKRYLARIFPILDQIVDAVGVLHEAKILHRDIKPNNVLLDARGNAWLSDFGLARKEWQLMTKQGRGVGTTGYASLEQWLGKEADSRSDVFSLGATLYKALTLCLPYGSSGPNEDSTSPESPSRLQRLLSRDFDVVLHRCLKISPDQRYPSTEKMRDAWYRARSGWLPDDVGLLRRAIRFIRRHPIAVAAVLTMLFLLGTLGRTLWYDPTIRRTVYVETDPPGAKIVLVLIDPQTGDEKIIGPPKVTPATVRRVPVGEYLVEAQLEDGRFHEVYRLVPRPGQDQINPNMAHLAWVDHDDESVSWPTITIPDAAVMDSMVEFSGGNFTMGAAHLLGVPPHTHWVYPFYLDQTEVTVAAYRRIKGNNPTTLAGDKTNAPDSHAVTFVSFDQALDCAEKMGKRLPFEEEYEFAATNAGTSSFPWGDDATRIVDWPIGEVGKPEYDRTATNPPVYGLFSNVAEWTLSWPRPYPGVNPDISDTFYLPETQAIFGGTRVIRGGPYPVARGDPAPQGKDRRRGWDPRWRYYLQRGEKLPGLGFRCARSVKPRYLEQ
jgi:serine/threonine protein kinase/formylglycine-generating enzyme required for sulfatase activity